MGGVAGGIAQRTGLDLALVRGLILVLVIFGGVGVLLYGIAWALLPEPDGRIHVEQAGRGSWTSGLTGATILVALGLLRPDLRVFRGGNGLLWELFWIGAVVLVGYWILKRSGKGTPPPGSPDADRAAPPASGRAMGPGDPASLLQDDASAEHTLPAPRDDAASDDRPDAPQENAAPLYPLPYQPGQSAWAGSSLAYSGDTDQRPPLRTAAPVARPRALRPPGSTTALLIGAAIIVATLVLALDHTGILGLTNALVVALAAGAVVLALGVVVLGVRGRTSGLVGFIAALATIGALIASFTIVDGTWALAQQSIVRPSTPGAASDGYSSVASSTTIDLTELPGLTEDLVVPLNALASDVTVLVPEDVPVDVQGRVPLGSVDTRSTGSDAAARTFEGGILDVDRDELTPGTTGSAIILDLGGALSDITVVFETNEPAPTGETP